ncbi:MAG TPA: type VI secretion protein IcmF/TssM N-terminal domain-containing protein, partial [Pirellulaceae bacterium]|nr:type VI secretion protein IcmF/TssM N-terminal domain-containing protein [Pirellulaceae bacterium]
QRGTMMLGGPFYGMPAGGASGATASPSTAPARLASSDAAEPGSQGGMEPVLVAPQYSAVCLQQLQFIGRLLRRVRNPVCALNGVLVLLQYESIFSSPAELDELQKAIHADLATIQYATQVRCPVTALIVGLERERGFQELVRRVGRERALTQRFGRKFDVRCLPTSEELTALSIHVCGAFEDWAYALFREAEALTRPGNERLYELLSKVRCTWKVRLGDLLAGGFGSEPGDDASTDSLLFSGCYVAATGDTPDRQAFVKGVIDKLHEEQELVEWTDEALASQRFYERLVMTGSYLAAAGALGLAGLMTYRWLKK